VTASDVIKPRLLVVRMWTAGHEAVVGHVFDVLVQRHDVDVLQADVDTDT